MADAAYVKFVADDRYGLWQVGEVAEDLGWESDHPDAPPIRLLRLYPGQVISLEDPLGRGIVVGCNKEGHEGSN